MEALYISVVIPVYGCCSSLNELYQQLNKELKKISENFEIIFVNDSSPDHAWDTILDLAKKDKRVKGLNFTRNFGQHHAISAGLDYAEGKWVIVMDCDLQDKPEEIKKLHQKAVEGYDAVFGRRLDRRDNFFRRLSSKLFHSIFKYLTDVNTDPSIANFSILSSSVVKQFRTLKEQNRTYVLFVKWLGFKQTTIDIIHSERKYGKSSYSVKTMFKLALDSIITHSNKPLSLSIKFGFMLSLVSFLYALWLIIKYYVYITPIPGWTSVMVSIYFVGGLLMTNIGFVGLYIGKIFNEAKNRPIYIIKNRVNI